MGENQNPKQPLFAKTVVQLISKRHPPTTAEINIRDVDSMAAHNIINCAKGGLKLLKAIRKQCIVMSAN